MQQNKTDTTDVFISIGSNMGDKYNNCIQGIQHLDALSGITVVSVSPFYKTEPVDYTDQDWFVNGAIKMETKLDPEALMLSLKHIEQALGQYEKTVRFGPRILDLDIIMYGNLISHSDRVTLPHPRMHKRCFVLKPLCDIAPNTVHPVLKKSFKELLSEVENDMEQEVVLFRQADLPSLLNLPK